jgi:peptidyl-tRNA hydrolase
LRVGIRPLEEERLRMPLEDFVLGPFAADERGATLALLPKLTDVAERWMHEGVTAAMHLHTRAS